MALGQADAESFGRRWLRGRQPAAFVALRPGSSPLECGAYRDSLKASPERSASQKPASEIKRLVRSLRDFPRGELDQVPVVGAPKERRRSPIPPAHEGRRRTRCARARRRTRRSLDTSESRLAENGKSYCVHTV